MNLYAFRTMYPEFATVRDDSLIQAFLAQASASLDPNVCGTRFDEMHGLLTAHQLVMSPHGKAMRLQPSVAGGRAMVGGQPYTSAYWPRYYQCLIEVTSGLGKVV